MKRHRGIFNTIFSGLVALTLVSCKLSDQLAAQTAATNRAAAATEAAVAATTAMPGEMQAKLRALIPEMQAAAKATGTQMIDDAMQKALVTYMQIQQQARVTAQDLIRSIGPELLKTLTEMPPDQQAKVEAAFNRLVSNSPVATIGTQFTALNQNLQNGFAKIDGAMDLAKGGLQAVGGIQQQLGTLNKNLAGLKTGIDSATGKVEKLAGGLGLSFRAVAGGSNTIVGMNENAKVPTDLVTLPDKLPVIRNAPH